MAIIGVPKGKLPLLFTSPNVNVIDAECDYYFSNLGNNFDITQPYMPIVVSAVSERPTDDFQSQFRQPAPATLTRMKFNIIANTLDGTANLNLNINGSDSLIVQFDGSTPLGILTVEDINLIVPINQYCNFHYTRGTTTIDGLIANFSHHWKWS